MARDPELKEAALPVLDAQKISKGFSDHVVLADVSLTIRRGERIGLVGRNGSGKSTLARILAGIEPSDRGTVMQQRGAVVRYLAQEPTLDGALTARELVGSGLAAWTAAKARYDEAARAVSGHAGATEADIGTALAAQAAALADVEQHGGWAADKNVEVILTRLGMPNFDKKVGQMSGGERRRVALAELLVAAPELAILDEPTNHLDAETIAWLEEYLENDFPGALLLITHDRYVLDRVATRTVEIEQGKLYSYDGGWTVYLESRAERQALDDRTESNRQNLLRRELEWLSRQPKARTGKQKARIQRAEAAVARAPAAKREGLHLEIESKRLGGTILELDGLSLEIGGRRLIDKLTLHLTKGERIGVVGPNGTGKTSLLKCILGELAPASGHVKVGKNTRFAYFDQGRASLDLAATVSENVALHEQMVTFNGRDMTIHSYLEQFLLSGPKLRQPVGSLSGGEQARVALAKLLLGATNVLLLDEPTNDLDVDTLGALEELLLGFQGSVLVVTHDRYFLDRVATSILAFDGAGQVDHFPGNYTSYAEARAERLREEQGQARLAAKTAASERPTKARAGLTHAERRELAQVLARTEALEARLKDLERELTSPTLYAEGPERPTALFAEQRTAQVELDTLLARWEELESRNTGS